MSKGSKQRPVLDQATFESNWDTIFGKKSKEDKQAKEITEDDKRKSAEEL
jgi:hypothetical protein